MEELREVPPPPAHRGTNQAGMRAHNERLVLSLVRRNGPLAKSEIARITGLSAQTVSVIMRHLEADHLLRRGEPQRGRVGQPLVPLSLDPEGAFFLGAKIGRRSLDVVLVDFAGGLRRRASVTYGYPKPDDVVRLIRDQVAAFEAGMGPMATRIAGLGIAMPFGLWEWSDELEAPAADLAAWRHRDVAGELARDLRYPVYIQNDATAACGAQLAFGENSGLEDFLYFYVGAFVGGGVVISGSLFAGRSGNAGAIGSMPVPDGEGGSVQLIDVASLVVLERRLRAAGLPSRAVYDPKGNWAVLGDHLDRWLATAGRGIAHAIAAGSTIVDFQAAVIDGPFPADVHEQLLAQIEAELRRLDLSGITSPEVRRGAIGPLARALGGASLPLFDRYLVDPHVLSGAGRGRRVET